MNTYLYDTLTDGKLVSLVKNGEVNAYETLVLRHQNKVLAQALAVTHNKCLAEDASQDAFITAWLKLDMLAEPEKFGAWVKQIARRRAIDILSRMRQYVGIDEIAEFADHNADVSERIIEEEQYSELRTSVERLPGKIKEVIRLYYFEGLSVAEISARMKTPAGTVKWRLSEGRRKLRGDLSAMTENENDKLIEKVMKKVAELRLWRLRSEYYGFDEAYADVMADVEAMSESKEKYAAKAEVMLLGWEYRPDYKHTVKTDDIKEAALAGGCEPAMKFIVDKEDANHSGDGLIEFVTKTQIPFLHENGFTETEAHEQYKLACAYLEAGDRENAEKARDSVFALVTKQSPEYAAAKALFEGYDEHSTAKDKDDNSIYCGSMELRNVGGDLVYWGMGSSKRFGEHSHYSECVYHSPFCAGIDCDKRLYVDGARVGDIFTATDGTTLTFVSDNETVTTAAGTFEGCEKWTTDTFRSHKRTTTYFKRGVGVVKTEVSDVYEYSFELAEYVIVGGSDRLPLAAGNRWKYQKTGYFDFERCDTFEVTSADASGAVLAFVSHGTQNSEDSPSWDGVLYQISNRYYNQNENGLKDVRDKLDLLDTLAVSEYERAVSKMARSTMERIWRGDSDDSGEEGDWNFFQINSVHKRGGMVLRDDEYRWQHSFEWKRGGNEKCLHNMIYDILSDTVGCLFSEEWLDGEPHIYHCFKPWKRIDSTIVCTNVGRVTTAAGTFDDCVDVNIAESELSHLGGLWYRSGEMTYTFARGVGIIRAVHNSGRDMSIYELTSYEGVGEGYMPVEVGMRRRYDCVNMDRGYFASSDYAFVTSPTGQLVLVADLCGQRRLPKKETADVRGLVELMKKGYAKHPNENEWYLADVSDIASLLPSRVKNDYDKILAEYASRVMKRIFDTDGTVNPSRTEAGRWNFFVHYCMKEKDGRLSIAKDDRTLSFEWKDNATWQMLYTFMLDILNDNVGCMWDNSWEIGCEYQNGQTKFSLSRAKEIVTAAGTFADCMKLDIDAANQNVDYFNGRREYYFANGVGIVRVVNHRGENEADVVYELSSYNGAVNGYMSAVPGIRRRYELIDPEPGVIASVEFACELDPESGDPVFFVDQYGCMKL